MRPWARLPYRDPHKFPTVVNVIPAHRPVRWIELAGDRAGQLSFSPDGLHRDRRRRENAVLVLIRKVLEHCERILPRSGKPVPALQIRTVVRLKRLDDLDVLLLRAGNTCGVRAVRPVKRVFGDREMLSDDSASRRPVSRAAKQGGRAPNGRCVLHRQPALPRTRALARKAAHETHMSMSQRRTLRRHHRDDGPAKRTRRLGDGRNEPALGSALVSKL